LPHVIRNSTLKCLQMMWKFTVKSWMNMRFLYFKRSWLLFAGGVGQTLCSLTKPSAMLCTVWVGSLNITVTLLMVNQFQAWSVLETLGFDLIQVSNLINMYQYHP
jgi:hypothetical protein